MLILVIDDSLTIRTILHTCLQREGYHVMSFPDGVQALQWLGTPEAALPDLVFVDLCLPKMDGYQVIRHLKTKPAFEKTVFVILSRHDGVLDRLKERLVGASAHLSKPFKTQEVVSLVQTLTYHE